MLNADGERLLQQIAPVLDTLSTAAVEMMTSSTDVLRLRLGILPLFASQRLFPRFGELRVKHPELHLDIDTAGHGLARLGDGLDAVITLAKEVDPALYAKRLDRNLVNVIGARALIEGPDPITRPEQLRGLTALVHRDMPDTLVAWRNAAGLPELEPLAIDHFDSGALMLEAAAQGLGVAFAARRAISTRRMIARLPTLFDIEVESPYSYWFACRPRALAAKARLNCSTTGSWEIAERAMPRNPDAPRLALPPRLPIEGYSALRLPRSCRARAAALALGQARRSGPCRSI